MHITNRPDFHCPKHSMDNGLYHEVHYTQSEMTYLVGELGGWSTGRFTLFRLQTHGTEFHFTLNLYIFWAAFYATPPVHCGLGCRPPALSASLYLSLSLGHPTYECAIWNSYSIYCWKMNETR